MQILLLVLMKRVCLPPFQWFSDFSLYMYNKICLECCENVKVSSSLENKLHNNIILLTYVPFVWSIS